MNNSSFGIAGNSRAVQREFFSRFNLRDWNFSWNFWQFDFSRFKTLNGGKYWFISFYDGRGKRVADVEFAGICAEDDFNIFAGGWNCRLNWLNLFSFSGWRRRGVFYWNFGIGGSKICQRENDGDD